MKIFQENFSFNSEIEKKNKNKERIFHFKMYLIKLNAYVVQIRCVLSRKVMKIYKKYTIDEVGKCFNEIVGKRLTHNL